MGTIDFNEVAVFIKIVQVGSFSEAAKQMNMPNSTVSARISSLERRLGITLLNRTTRRLKLTELGCIYFEECVAAFETVMRAESAIKAHQSEPSGRLRLSTPGFANYLLTNAIVECRRKYPLIQIEVVHHNKPFDMIAEGVDIALMAGPIDNLTLIAKTIGQLRCGLFASPFYFAHNGSPRHPHELNNYSTVQFTCFGKTTWSLTKGDAQVQMTPSASIIVDDMHAAKAIAVSGGGITMLPLLACANEIKQGKIVQILKDWQAEGCRIQFAYHPQKFPLPKLRAFLEVAEKSAKEILCAV